MTSRHTTFTTFGHFTNPTADQMFLKYYPPHFFKFNFMPAHIGTLAFVPTLKANPSAKAKEPIF